jgi:hypothetical protein
MESKQPENEYEKEPKAGLFSRINKKIKRKRPESEHLKDAADTIAKINKEKEERKQNEFNNGRMR